MSILTWKYLAVIPKSLIFWDINYVSSMKRGNVKKNHKNNLFGIFQNAQFKNYYKIENNLIFLQSIYILKKICITNSFQSFGKQDSWNRKKYIYSNWNQIKIDMYRLKFLVHNSKLGNFQPIQDISAKIWFDLQKL